MARICVGAEQEPTSGRSQHRLGETFSRCDETVALSAMYAANHFPGIKAIISLTESGHTPLIMSRIRSTIPIYCYTRSAATQRRAALFRGVYPVAFDASTIDPDSIGEHAIDELKQQGLLQSGDWVVLTRGDLHGHNPHSSGGTNTMKILITP